MLPNNKIAKKIFFWISAFFGRFLTKKQPKTSQKNLQNPNCLLKFSEIWYVVASQQKNATKFFFWDFDPFWPFFKPETAKIDEK